MECKLELSVFRFNAKTDVLRYYKNHVLKIDRSKTLNDLLALVVEEDLSFGYPKDEYAAIKINDKALFLTTTIDDIVNDFGKELVLEPLNTKRSVHDLIINDDDFNASFDLLAPYVDSSDKEIFKSYIPYHYASSAVNLVEGFQGDALFVFAYDMIQKYPARKKDILTVIANEETGIFLHVTLCNKLYPCGSQVEEKIIALKNEIIALIPHANKLVEHFSHQI